MAGIVDRYRELDRRVSQWLESHVLVVLWYGLAVVFIWFGVLKPLGLSPATELAARTVP